MMQEILKPLLDNNVLTDEVKDSIETALKEAIESREQILREEIETSVRENFEVAKVKFENTYKTLESSYKVKLDEAKQISLNALDQVTELEAKIEELETKPFVNISESDLEAAEAKLVEELESKYEGAFDVAKEKFQHTFDVVVESYSDLIGKLGQKLEEAESKISNLQDICRKNKIELTTIQQREVSLDESINRAVAATEKKMRAEADARIETIKENLVTSTEIFLEQEISEIKADKENIMKEVQGRELLESIKNVVKQYWDIDAEIAEELLEMKKEANIKVEQYKDMLKKEHARLEESQNQVEKLKKKVILESKGSVLTSDKKEALNKLAENMESDKLETHIDELMESVISTFNSGFTKKEVNDFASKKSSNSSMLNESTNTKTTTIGSGDLPISKSQSDELAELLDFAGVRK